MLRVSSRIFCYQLGNREAEISEKLKRSVPLFNLTTQQAMFNHEIEQLEGEGVCGMELS